MARRSVVKKVPQGAWVATTCAAHAELAQNNALSQRERLFNLVLSRATYMNHHVLFKRSEVAALLADDRGNPVERSNLRRLIRSGVALRLYAPGSIPTCIILPRSFHVRGIHGHPQEECTWAREHLAERERFPQGLAA